MAQQPLVGQAPHYRGFTIALRHSTLGKTPLDEWPARRRDLFLTTQNIHKKQISKTLGGIRTRNPNEQAVAEPRLDDEATGIGRVCDLPFLILGPATVGQYLDFETVHLKESEILIKMIHCYLIHK